MHLNLTIEKIKIGILKTHVIVLLLFNGKLEKFIIIMIY